MKQLFNDVSGRSLDIAFESKATNKQITEWVKHNLDEIVRLDVNINEIDSCMVSLDWISEDTIVIDGDEDLIYLNIRELNVIKLK